MVQAMAHSRPPSYRSHISDHEVILPPVHHLPKPPVAEEPEDDDDEADMDDGNIVVTSADVVTHELNQTCTDNKPSSAVCDYMINSPKSRQGQADKPGPNFVDIKDVSTDSSVVSVSSSSSSSRGSPSETGGRHATDGQVTIIHHQQARPVSSRDVTPAVTTANLVTVSSPPPSTCLQQPLSVSALVTAAPDTAESHVIDVEGPDVEILAHL